MIHFLSVFPPYRGGISKFSDYLFKEISQKSEIKAWNFKKLYPNFLFPGMSQYLKEGEAYSNRLVRSFNPMSWQFSSRKIKPAQDHTLLYSYWHPFFAPCLKAHAARFRNNGGKVVGLFHNVVPHEAFPFQNKLIRNLLGVTDDVMLLSDQTKQELNALEPGQYCHTLFHPVYEQEGSILDSSDIREKYGITESEKVVLFFGLIREYKGLDILIEAFNQMDIKKNNIRPLIIGEFYADKKQILSGINEPDAERYIVRDEYVTDEVMAEVFKISDVTVLPYRTASQSGILSNAINFATPVIVSNHSGLTQFIEHDKHGIVLKENNAEQLSEALRSAFRDSNQSQWRANLNRLKKDLSWSRFGDEFLKLMQESH